MKENRDEMIELEETDLQDPEEVQINDLSEDSEELTPL